MELSNQHYLDHWKSGSFTEYWDGVPNIIGYDPETGSEIQEGDCCVLPLSFLLYCDIDEYDDIPF